MSLTKARNASGGIAQDERCAARRAATGLGLFAARPLAAGRRVVEYVGEVISNDEADARGGKYLFRIDSRRVIDGAARANIARYIDRSCRPNSEAFSARGRVWVCSEQKIEAGAEITLDHGTEYFDEHIAPVGCKCPYCAGRRQRRAAATDSE